MHALISVLLLLILSMTLLHSVVDVDRVVGNGVVYIMVVYIVCVDDVVCVFGDFFFVGGIIAVPGVGAGVGVVVVVDGDNSDGYDDNTIANIDTVASDLCYCCCVCLLSILMLIFMLLLLSSFLFLYLWLSLLCLSCWHDCHCLCCYP